MKTIMPRNALQMLLLVVLALSLVGMLNRSARAQTTVPDVPARPRPTLPAPTTAVDKTTCTSDGCHAEVKAYKSVHGPVNVNACDACHKLTDAAAHKYEMTRPKADMCTFCHKLDTKDMAVVHQPVKTGDCAGCHNPHGGTTVKILRGETLKATCDRCHKDVVAGKKFMHGPVAAGACDACHKSHASNNPKLLVDQGKALCINCHKEMNEQLKNAKVTHKPVMQGECVQCHDPHASNYKMQVKAEPFTLCTSCHDHDKIKDVATNSKVKHSAVLKDQACTNCHTPHGGALAKLMKAQPVDLCMKCHNQEQKTSYGRVVQAVPEVQNPKLSKHGPVRDGNCSGCHNVHGSDQTRLLAKAYPETFYAKFDPENFALCFTCHDKKLVETKDAEGLTGFRNGTRNLHFVHVDKDKGRTCRACHETHAGPNPAHIRNSVPFGQWELPLNFKKTATGGSCAPGCHKEYGYDRNTPVDNGTQTQTPAPTMPTTPAATESATSAPAAPSAAAPALTPAPATAPAPAATAPAPASTAPAAAATRPAIEPSENISTINLRPPPPATGRGGGR
jgi:predicted CXXCH cytochrome family protein